MKIIFYIICSSLIFGNYSIIQSNSKVEYFGHHPMHGFSGEASSIKLISECDDSADLCDLIFKVPVFSLSSGNDNRDSNMLNYLNVFLYPEITLIVEDFIVRDYNEENIVCKMIISGVNRQIDIPLTLLEVSKKEYKASSSFIISLKDFNIEIPKLLFIPIDDEIKINVEFLIQEVGGK